MIYGPFFKYKYKNIYCMFIRCYTPRICVGCLFGYNRYIYSLTFPFVWQTKVTFYNKDQFSSREREKKKGILMDTFNLWEDILGFFSYSIFLIFFSLCVCVWQRERVGQISSIFFTALQMYIRELMLGCTEYTVAPPIFLLDLFILFTISPFFFLKFFFKDF